MVRHDYYQTDAQLTLTVYAKAQAQDKVDVRVHGNELLVRLTDGTELRFALYAPVHPAPAVHVFSTKLEIVLTKAAPGTWPALEGTGAAAPVPTAPAPAAAPSAAPRARSKWDALEVEEEAPAGADAELNAFFKKLYADADDDTRRAMMKSFQESNGTALSTNWAEVSKKKTETRAPAGMVAKNYEA
ncbi:hypothetical protein CBS9595_004033 [Malassezia furfur]|nr:hypothetical protein CBS9595_004033 [Malassezia furfur]